MLNYFNFYCKLYGILEFGCFHPVVCIYTLLECAVYTQQTVISCNLLQLVNKRHVSASQGHHQAYKDGFN